MAPNKQLMCILLLHHTCLHTYQGCIHTCYVIQTDIFMQIFASCSSSCWDAGHSDFNSEDSDAWRAVDLYWFHPQHLSHGILLFVFHIWGSCWQVSHFLANHYTLDVCMNAGARVCVCHSVIS